MRTRLLLASTLAALAFAGDAQALFRAYLSKNGSDLNPCTLALPCRLLPAALAAVDSGGDIWIVDSANFNTGTVAVTKSVTILAIPGAVGSIVANGGTAMTINGAGIHVTLQNLQFRYLAGAEPKGIEATAAASVTLDGVVMTGLGNALEMAAVTAFSVSGSAFRRNNTAIVASAATQGTVTRTRITGPGVYGVALNPAPVTAQMKVAVTDSEVSGMSFGFIALAGSNLFLGVSRSTVSNNSTAFHHQGTAGATFALSGNTVTGNQFALSNVFSGALDTYQDNFQSGNTNEASGTITNRTLR